MKTHRDHINAYQKLRKRVCKEKCTTMDNIINVSSHTLTNSEIKLLNRGLSFIPKPHVINNAGLLRDFDQLVRKLVLTPGRRIERFVFELYTVMLWSS